MTDLTEAIAARMDARGAAAEEARQEFVADPELERAGERMDLMRETSPKEFADANFGGLRNRVTTYRARKAAHERNTR